jgi:lipopolysaccharide export LptBFGC system permease protein LptF
MRLLDRYVLRELLIWLGLILVFGLICIIAFDLFTSLNRFQENHLQFGDVFDLYLARIPSLLVFILPVVLLISLLITVTSHARHNELTAMRAAGISLWRICAPHFIVGILLSIAVFAMNELWVPDTNAKVDEIMRRHQLNNTTLDPNRISNLGFPNARDGRNWLIGLYNVKTEVMINPRVDWRDGGAKWHMIATRAEYIDGVWTFFGDTIFTTNDIANLEGLAAKLRPKGATNAIERYISSQLSPVTLAILDAYHSGPSPDTQRVLTENIDRIMFRGPLYEKERFAGVKLQPDTEKLLAQNPEGIRELELNRMLLLDAFPLELSRNGLNTVKVYKGEAPKYEMRPYLDTNMLAMPLFTETPREFANEAKFNSRFQKLNANPTEVPIVELRDYSHLHPNLSPERKRWLNTQLHSRLAMPWSCIVVVLIAIPFSAGSGRRNIFMGVAGSIIICFVYLVLMQMGLALGIGGFVPAWIAAWLPNAFFAVTGFWLILRVR